MKKNLLVSALFVLVMSASFGQTTEKEWYEKAGEYFDSGDYARAITAYSETIKRNSSNLDAYLLRGIAYYQTKNYDAAIADYDTIIKGEPDIPIGYVVRGDAYGAKGVYLRAVADYKTGLEKGHDPSDFKVDKSSKADMWFCGTLYMEIAVNRFLGNSAALAKYENWLKTVCDKNNVTRAEVESFYRQNIGALIAAAVDAEFGKVSRFMIDRKYNAVLTRNPQNGQYELSYTGVENATKKLSASTLEALSSAMSKSGDFSATAFNVVREQAALIPAVVLAEIGTADTFLGTVKKALADFYLSPTTANYNIVKDISALFTRRAREYNQDTFFWMVSSSYDSVLSELSLPLASKVFSDMNQEKYTALTLTQAQIRALTVQR